MRTLICYAFALGLLGSALACSGSDPKSGTTAPNENDALAEVGGMIRNYSAEFGRGPAKQADLAKYQTEGPHGWKALTDGRVVVVWGATVAGEGNSGSGGTGVVAFLKEVPESGGRVLLENGTSKEMTADEFKAAPKAGKK